MQPYYQDRWVTQYCSDALKVLSELEGESIDLLATDPPYGIGFMGKDWDRALPDKAVWAECLRLLKPGSFAFVMSIPRADCLSRMIISLEDAGFLVNFTPIFWAYASGFPKAQNIGKVVDRKLGAKREVIGKGVSQPAKSGHFVGMTADNINKTEGRFSPDLTPIPVTPKAKALDGSYSGFQPKPAVEVIIVAMKPLSEKTFVDQALKNRKGITWLDDGRIPYESDKDSNITAKKNAGNALLNRDKLYGGYGDLDPDWQNPSGRFPANLLVSDDVLNDGFRKTSSHYSYQLKKAPYEGGWKSLEDKGSFADSGSFSRYFDLDKWWAKTFPFLIVAKASKSEKNRGLDFEPAPIEGRDEGQDVRNVPQKARNTPRINQHPTVKPLKLMSYLITLGSRVGDTVIDPFSGSGTTPVVCQLLNRYCTAIEIEEKYCEISVKRYSQGVMELNL